MPKPRASCATALALISTLALACGTTTDAAGPVEQGADEIVSVAQTDVERQSIGSSWLYAQARWVESLHDAATGEAFDVSESYWAYWHWFDQIANGVGIAVSTGGNWHTGNAIAKKYGIVPERDFIPGTPSEVAARQTEALAIVNESLARGVLAPASSRRDKVLVRRELDRAWGLSAASAAALDGVFGSDVSRTFSSITSRAQPARPVQRVEEFKVAYSPSPRAAPVQKTLADAMGAWRQVFYAGTDRRSFQLRVQSALYDKQPVIVTWFVDFNALEIRDNGRRGSFNITTLNELGPGSQGGHAALVDGYEARLADGRVVVTGALDATNPEDRSLLDAALLPSTHIGSLRVKNGWGAARPVRASIAGMPEHHDLYFDYLDGPVMKCLGQGSVATRACASNTTPLQSVVLPPGY